MSIFTFVSAFLACAVLLVQPLAAASTGQQGGWEKDKGKPAPELTAAAWVGTPVSLASLRGNTVVIFFWNADIPC